MTSSLLLLILACGEKDSADADSGVTDDSGQADDSAVTADDSDPVDDSDPADDTGEALPDNTCTRAFDDVQALYADAGELRACTGDGISAELEASLMNLRGMEIEIRGTSFEPCVELRCDDDWAYVFSNNLQHYDGVQGVPAVGEETRMVYRLPLEPVEVSSSRANPLSDTRDCEAAYEQLLAFPDTATTTEPGGYCQQGGASYVQLPDGSTAAQASCLATNGFSINGQWVVGSTEAANPDPWGNPGFFFPYTGQDDYQVGMGSPVLDLCGAHGHHHAINPDCFVLNDDQTPAVAYSDVEASFNLEDFVSGPSCTEEGQIVGWAVDGVPILAPCACMERDGQGQCTEAKTVRSGFVYAGMASRGEDEGEEAALGQEGMSCQDSSQCTDDSMVCSYAVVSAPQDPDLTRVNQQCVLVDYVSCTHEFVDRSAADLSGSALVYADACNGVETADGYRYFATGSWPFVPLCLRYEPSDSLGGGLLDGR